jgi:hypothetical protein
MQPNKILYHPVPFHSVKQTKFCNNQLEPSHRGSFHPVNHPIQDRIGLWNQTLPYRVSFFMNQKPSAVFFCLMLHVPFSCVSRSIKRVEAGKKRKDWERRVFVESTRCAKVPLRFDLGRRIKMMSGHRTLVSHEVNFVINT